MKVLFLPALKCLLSTFPNKLFSLSCENLSNSGIKREGCGRGSCCELEGSGWGSGSGHQPRQRGAGEGTKFKVRQREAAQQDSNSGKSSQQDVKTQARQSGEMGQVCRPKNLGNQMWKLR